MEDLRELYQQVILDHNKAPRNFGALAEHTHYAEGDNPLCGDHLDLYLKIEGDTIVDLSFEGKGCAISKASASLMTDFLKGKTIEEAKTIFKKFHELITDKTVEPNWDELGKLAVLAGVKAFPVRVKCASLSWHTFIQALEKPGGKVSTE